VPGEHPPPPELAQEVEPGLSVKKEAGHGAQVEADVAEFTVLKVLRGHWMGAPEPAGQYEPAGQAVFAHEAALADKEYVPALQIKQAAAPAPLKVPAAQGRHDVELL
jgi:hypothetical protein